VRRRHLPGRSCGPSGRYRDRLVAVEVDTEALPQYGHAVGGVDGLILDSKGHVGSHDTLPSVGK
jgi:hypothetical protein